jgi:hypothetical protein
LQVSMRSMFNDSTPTAIRTMLRRPARWIHRPQ